MGESGSEQVFDELLIPVLNYAKRDLQRGHLTEEGGDSLLRALRESFSKVDLYRKDSSGSDDAEPDGSTLNERPHRIKLLGCAADGDTDRTAVAMLNELLDPARWDVEIVVEETLTSELVARVAQRFRPRFALLRCPPEESLRLAASVKNCVPPRRMFRSLWDDGASDE